MAEAQTVMLREHLAAGSTLRYAIRAVHQLAVDYNRELGPGRRAEDIQRKYELTGVLAIRVAAAGADGSARLEARFEELRVSEWLWGDDWAEAEEMVAALGRQRLQVTRDAAGNVKLTGTQRIRLDRFRPDIQSLEALATLPLLDFGTGPVEPGSRWQREIPAERYHYHDVSGAGASVNVYEYVGNRTLGGRNAALLVVESSLPLAAMPLPGEAERTAERIRQGMRVGESGESRRNRLELVELEKGLRLAVHEWDNLFYRLTVRRELADPQANIPVPLMTVRFTGNREVRWLGPGDTALVAAVEALPALEELWGERRAGAEAEETAESSLGEIARKQRAQRARVPAPAAPRAPNRRRRTEERELVHFPVNEPVAGANVLTVRFDPRTSRDGNGAVLVSARVPIVVPLYSVENVDVEEAQLVYQAWLRTEDLVGQAYLEMWCVFEGGGEFFSRGLAQALTGSHGWIRVETPFFLERGQKPSQVRLNLVVNGRGQVWIDDIRLLVRPLP